MSRVPTRRDVFVASLRHALRPYRDEVNRIGHATLLRGLRRILLITTALRGSMATPMHIWPTRWRSYRGPAERLDPGESLVVDNHHVKNVGSVPLSLSLGRR